MEPLSRLFFKKINTEEDKIKIITLIAVILFDFLLFPLPSMAAGKTVEDEISDEDRQYYLVSQESIDNGSFVVISKAKGYEKTISTNEQVAIIEETTASSSEEIANQPDDTIKNHLPINQDKKVVKTRTSVITAYNSEVAQCDASPCTTATGFNVCKHGIEDTVAANHLPFGTKIKIPALFGDRIFIVRDRMNKRYTNRIDVWMVHKKDALQLGVRTAAVEIVE